MCEPQNTPNVQPVARRHDMDAIRGGAMVLVVTVHASLSLYIGMPWVFSDSTQNVTTTLLVNFMMATSVPMFFTISGYFTEQTLQRYGVKGMLRRRFRSVLRPPLGIGAWALVSFFGIEMTESFYIGFTPKAETTIPNRWPALLLYGSFFFWGAWYFNCQREEERFGRYWRLTLPVVLVVIFPVGIELVYGFWGFRDLFGAWEAQVFFANVLVVLFVWLALYSTIGLARDHLSRPNRAFSLLYAGSFWVYLVHMPVAIVAQWAFLHVPIPGLVKLVLMAIITLAVPLLPYLYIVRGTWLDHFIHGRQLKEPQMGRAN